MTPFRNLMKSVLISITLNGVTLFSRIENIRNACKCRRYSLPVNLATRQLGKRQLGNPATRQPGNSATRQIGNPATRQLSNRATRQPGNSATRQLGNLATRQLGNSATQQLANPATRQPGYPATRQRELNSVTVSIEISVYEY